MDKLFFIYLISELLNCICHDLNVTGSYELKSTLEKLFFNYYYEKRHNINYDGSASSGKCNMIGLWHKDNSYDTNVISYSRVQQDTKLCSNLSNYVDHYNPIVDYALLDSYSTISSPDRKDFPDIVNIPTVVGAIVPIVNLKLNRDQKAYLSPLKLAKSTLVQIFFGEISYWNDRSILKDNANTSSYDILNGVDAKIQLILPEEYDGHVDLFLKALSSFNSSRISYDRLLVNDNVIKVSDSRKVIEEVLNTPYSISWCSLSEALFNGVEMISLLNSDGYAVRANHESLSYALFERIDEIKINPESNDNSLINGQNKLSWPISQYYYNSFRLSSHVGNCQRRQDAVASVLQFYDSRHTDWIESNGDIITLPDFTASQFKTYIINKANCSDGSRAVVSITDENFHVLTSDSIRPIVETWLNVYYSASKTESKVNIISSNDSIILDRHFESNPDFYYGLFTIRKDEEMNKLTSNGQTDPYLILIQTVGFIPIVPIYNIPSFMSVFNQTVSLVVGPQLLVDIFSGSIRYWDDNRIKDMNSHAAPLLPHEKIHLIFREKNSDSQSLFFRYLGLKTSDPYFDNPNPEDRFEAADFQYAYDDKDMDLKVSRTPYAMGFFVMTYSPTSPVVSFCTAGHCDDSKDVTSVLIDLSNHNQVVNAVSSCLFDFNTIKNPNSDVLTYDLMLSSAPSCYPITATIDWITFRGESDSCSQSSQTCTSSYSICEFNQTNLVDERVKFSAWIFSESTMNKLFYSQLSPVVPTPMDARINSFVAACDVTCQEAPLGFTYCGYYECSSSRGDYERVISDCDPKWITRDIHYRVIEGRKCYAKGRWGDRPSSGVIQCNFVPFTSVPAVLAYFLIFVGILGSSALVFYMYIHRKSKYIEDAQPVHLCVMMFGVILMLISATAFIGPSTITSCMCRVWLLNFSSTLMFIPLILRMYQQQNVKNTWNLLRIKTISNLTMLSKIIGVLLIVVVFVILWTAVDWPHPVREEVHYTNVKDRVEISICTTDVNPARPFELIGLIVKAIVIIFGVRKGFQIWNDTSDFGEQQHYSFAVIFIAFVATVTYFPSLFISLELVAIRQMLRAFGIVICALIPVIIIMLPKVLAQEGIWNSEAGNAFSAASRLVKVFPAGSRSQKSKSPQNSNYESKPPGSPPRAGSSIGFGLEVKSSFRGLGTQNSARGIGLMAQGSEHNLSSNGSFSVVENGSGRRNSVFTRDTFATGGNSRRRSQTADELSSIVRVSSSRSTMMYKRRNSNSESFRRNILASNASYAGNMSRQSSVQIMPIIEEQTSVLEPIVAPMRSLSRSMSTEKLFGFRKPVEIAQTDDPPDEEIRTIRPQLGSILSASPGESQQASAKPSPMMSPKQPKEVDSMKLVLESVSKDVSMRMDGDSSVIFNNRDSAEDCKMNS